MRDPMTQVRGAMPRRAATGGRLAMAVFLLVYGATVVLTLAPSDWLRQRAPITVPVPVPVPVASAAP